MKLIACLILAFLMALTVGISLIGKIMAVPEVGLSPVGLVLAVCAVLIGLTLDWLTD
jgi:hypothetical protein